MPGRVCSAAQAPSWAGRCWSILPPGSSRSSIAPVDSYTILFAIGFAFSFLSVLILQTLHAPREAGFGEFAGLFFHGNAFMAISSMIRFYYAREETDVLAATERLGSARSPLTVEELIGSLNDPRFYVRFEAIVSITRHRPDDRLVEALVEVMEAPDPALAVIAAWALGRMGGVQAIPALRKTFTGAKYHSVRAHAARALGTLGDRESIPFLLEEARRQCGSGAEGGLRLQPEQAAGGRGRSGSARHSYILTVTRKAGVRWGCALARLLEAESEYIELSRSLYEDPGTTLAREVDGIRGSLSRNIGGSGGYSFIT